MNTTHLTTAALQIARLKGRINASTLAHSLQLDDSAASTLLQTCRDASALAEARDMWRLAPEGRVLLASRIELERAGIDGAALRAAYEDFHPFNTHFKELVTAWQLRDGAPNAHEDAAYDAGVIAQLAVLHREYAPLLARMSAQAGRLAPYQARLDHALAQLQAGEAAWFARPIIDSYHTVWFELHEDLIGLLGLSREAEAIAGRAE